MLKKKLTFLLIPGSEGVSKQLTIPLVLLYACASAIIFVVLANFFLSAEFFSDQVDQTELDRLRSENASLNEKFEEMRWHVAEIENRYSDLVQKEIRIRTFFDLPEINLEERQLGIGGPTSPELIAQSENEILAASTESKIDGLLRLSEFELEKYEEVETEISGIKERLNHTPSILPTKGWQSRGFGMKFDPFTGYKQMHRGIDIANKTGTAIIATANGVVRKAQAAGGMGRFIAIDHGYGFETRFGHLSKIMVRPGQTVRRGEVIGLVGSTGYSTGPHLHYEVIRNGKNLNPMDFILN